MISRGYLRAGIRRWRRTLFELVGSDRYSHLALNDLDRKLAAYVSYKGGTFIEAGANDGLSQSNTYWFERFRDWRGILIEPIPAMAATCRRNRPLAIVVNSALVATDEIGCIRMQTANLMAFVSRSFARPEDEACHLRTAIEVQELTSVTEIEVPARTLSSILAELGTPCVDLLSLDVEGYEIEALKGLDTSRHRPRFILIETSRLPEVLGTLNGQYEAIDQFSHHDHLLRVREPLAGQEIPS